MAAYLTWETLKHFLAGFLGGTVAVTGIAKFFGDWWLETRKSKYNRELEELKDKYVQEQEENPSPD